MLFNSYEFVLFFLPATLLGFAILARLRRHQLAVGWLVLASLFFYGWWNPVYLILLLSSVLANYGVGLRLQRRPDRRVLAVGLLFNLGLLGYFKYANFFLDNLNRLFSADFSLGRIVLPLAISFFTFQQIAYLVDCYRGETQEQSFLNYCLFVTFFPQLIAGPIVHHKEILPQIVGRSEWRIKPNDLAVGTTLFIAGLAKKVLIADPLSKVVQSVYAAADQGQALSLFEAWAGPACFAMQVYFDFSGYADMAIGAARMIGIAIPSNFDSPYKSASIIEIWQRWHISLSCFLRDYLYIPLGGNRKGRVRRYVNLFLTMVLGGLWHGAAWNYVVWGALNGAYLVINYGWRHVRNRLGPIPGAGSWVGRTAAVALTFACWTLSLAIFRAETLQGGFALVCAMFDPHALKVTPEVASWATQRLSWLPLQPSVEAARLVDLHTARKLLLLGVVVFFLPNSLQYVGLQEASGRSRWWRWRPNLAHLLVMAWLLLRSLEDMNEVSEFLYFQF